MVVFREPCGAGSQAPACGVCAPARYALSWQCSRPWATPRRAVAGAGWQCLALVELGVPGPHALGWRACVAGDQT